MIFEGIGVNGSGSDAETTCFSCFVGRGGILSTTSVVFPGRQFLSGVWPIENGVRLGRYVFWDSSTLRSRRTDMTAIPKPQRGDTKDEEK